MFSDFLLT